MIENQCELRIDFIIEFYYSIIYQEMNHLFVMCQLKSATEFLNTGKAIIISSEFYYAADLQRLQQ